MAQGRRRRRIAGSYDKEWYGSRDREVVIDDGCKGRVQCFCQLNRFVCLFIVHLLRFLQTSSILVRFFLSLKFFLALLFFASSNVSLCSCFHSAKIQLLKFALFSSAFAIVADEHEFIPPPHLLTLLDILPAEVSVQPSTSPQQRFHLLPHLNSKSRTTVHTR